jgi:predicted secreted acid phosphatase
MPPTGTRGKRPAKARSARCRALTAASTRCGRCVTVIFNTNRSAANADATARAIKAAGLGEAVHGQTLYLAGDDTMGSRKDGRRWTISRSYCVIALGGDQLGDFTDLFNVGQSVPARRAATQGPAIAQLWGAGWFVLPNPVYGSGLKGGFDDVFPADKRWAPPAQGEK